LSHPDEAHRWLFDWLFWIGRWLAWSDWQSALVIVRPATVIAWHRRDFARSLRSPAT